MERVKISDVKGVKSQPVHNVNIAMRCCKNRRKKKDLQRMLHSILNSSNTDVLHMVGSDLYRSLGKVAFQLIY